LGQRFWKLLVNHRILPQPAPGQFHDELLLANRFGITDIVKVPSARADTLDSADVDHGRTVLRKKIEDLKPRIVCSIYKTALERLLETKFKNQWGLVSQRLADSSIFILPFPYKSAAHTSFHMRQLSALLGRSDHDR
jgi:TDG/mug DNA glycosylase family protein